MTNKTYSLKSVLSPTNELLLRAKLSKRILIFIFYEDNLCYIYKSFLCGCGWDNHIFSAFWHQSALIENRHLSSDLNSLWFSGRSLLLLWQKVGGWFLLKDECNNRTPSSMDLIVRKLHNYSSFDSWFNIYSHVVTVGECDLQGLAFPGLSYYGTPYAKSWIAQSELFCVPVRPWIAHLACVCSLPCPHCVHELTIVSVCMRQTYLFAVTYYVISHQAWLSICRQHFKPGTISSCGW